MKRLLLLALSVTVISIAGFAFAGQASASPTLTDKTKLRVHILPLECVLEKINNGINDIHSLTPADCKKKIESVSPPPFVGSGSISAVPIPLPGEPFGAEENSPGSSAAIAVEDLGIDINAPKPDTNLFIRAGSLIFQTTAGILALLFISYVFITKLFRFL